MEEKSSLIIYRKLKPTLVNTEAIYNNKPASIIFLKCKTNTINLKERNRFTNRDTKGPYCEEITENLEHFILYRPKYAHKKHLLKELQPYEENTKELIGKILFENKNIEKIKDITYDFWKIRNRHSRDNT